MGDVLDKIRQLSGHGDIRISAYGCDELANDGILVREVLNALATGVMVEEYPNYPKGPCVLVLQADRNGAPVHVVWGIPKGHESPAVLITAYRPDPEQWDPTYRERR